MSIEYAAEALANLTPAMRISNGRSTRSDGLIGCELAGALAGLSEAESKLLIAKYISGSMAGAQSPDFYKLYLHAAIDLAVEQNWNTRGYPELLRKMTVLALVEILNPQICPTCGGSGFVSSKACKPCDSSGHRPITARARAELCDVAKSTWCETWALRYERLYSRISGMETDALRKVARQMRAE